MQAFGSGMVLFGGGMVTFESKDGAVGGQRFAYPSCSAAGRTSLNYLDEDGPRIITRSGKRALVDDAERKFARTTSIDASTDTGTDEAASSASDAGSAEA
jgi:hypothetical protein